MIQFESKDIEMPDLDFGMVEEWIELVADSYDCEVADITYTFINDEEMLRINNEELGHDYYTDIITFDDSIGTLLSAEIVISLDTVATNAAKFSQPYRRELLRVIIHGVLHLCGINDKGPGEREIMEENENRALALWDQIEAAGASHDSSDEV